MLLLENATIRTMGPEGVINGSILLGQGKILELAPRINLPQSADCEVIDMKHQLVMPGLVEAHCHMGITEEKKGKRGTTAMRPSTRLLLFYGQLMQSIRWMRLLMMP